MQIVTDMKDTRGTTSNEVVKAITAITTEGISQDDLPTLCFQLFEGSRSAIAASPDLKMTCLKLLEGRAVLESASAELFKKRAALLIYGCSAGPRAQTKEGPEGPSGSQTDVTCREACSEALRAGFG